MFRFIIIALFILFLSFSNSFAYLTHISRKIGDYNVNLIKVILDGNDYVVTSISESGEDLMSLVNKVGGKAGINGAYFMPKDYGFKKNDTNADRVFEGKQYFKFKGDFGARGMFGFKKNGEPLFIANNEGYVNGGIGKYNEDKINQLYYGISNYPILIFKGQNVLYKSKNLLDWKMKAKGPKNFICSRKNKVVILMGVVYNLTIYDLVDYLKNTLNCYNAILLDSGGSRGMVYNNKYIKKNGRPIMDAFVVVDKSHFKGEKSNWFKKYQSNIVKDKYQILADKINKKIIILVNKKFSNKSENLKKYYIKYYKNKVKEILLKYYKKTGKPIFLNIYNKM